MTHKRYASLGMALGRTQARRLPKPSLIACAEYRGTKRFAVTEIVCGYALRNLRGVGTLVDRIQFDARSRPESIGAPASVLGHE